MADVDDEGWPQRQGCSTNLGLATMDALHDDLAKPRETAPDVIRDLYEHYDEHAHRQASARAEGRSLPGGGPLGPLPDETVFDEWKNHKGIRFRRSCPGWWETLQSWVQRNNHLSYTKGWETCTAWIENMPFQQLLLVTGPTGSGKSMTITTAAINFNDGWNDCLLYWKKFSRSAVV